MRLGILSDTHDQVVRTAGAVALLKAEGAGALIHCGDLTGPAVVRVCGTLPSYYVFGNNDFDLVGLRRAMAAVGGVCLGRGGEVSLARRGGARRAARGGGSGGAGGGGGRGRGGGSPGPAAPPPGRSGASRPPGPTTCC